MSTIEYINLDSELTDESQPYLGVIILDEYQPNVNKDGWEWVMGVRPIDFTLKGEYGCFFNRAKPTTQKNSKMGIVLGSLQKSWGKMGHPAGKGFLRGRVGVFVNRNVSFGMGNDGTEIKARVIVLVRKPTPEEEARAQGIVDAIKSGRPLPSSEGVEAATATAADLLPTSFDESQQAAILQVIEGKTQPEFQMAALTSGLAPDLMNAILSGTALAFLKQAGKVELDESGRVVVKDEVLI